jgi:nucleoid-associated protein YgaU
MPRKAASSSRSAKKASQEPGVFDYLRFGESYTSLILGIIVVIVGTVLLLSLVRGRNTAPKPESKLSLQNTGTKIDGKNEVSFSNDERIISSATKRPEQTPEPTKEVQPTATPTAKPTATPVPTKIVVKKPTSAPTIKRQPTQVTITKSPKKQITGGGTKYTVKEGDTLWSIAEKTYKSGYNWVDIARANKLSNPDSLEKGTNLVLPKTEQKNETSEPEWTGLNMTQSANPVAKITGNKYKVVRGDTLWDIAVRAYGDGYQWAKLQSANKLSNPDLIIEGTDLNIPRK